jgi:hypothetical protein
MTARSLEETIVITKNIALQQRSELKSRNDNSTNPAIEMDWALGADSVGSG